MVVEHPDEKRNDGKRSFLDLLLIGRCGCFGSAEIAARLSPRCKHLPGRPQVGRRVVGHQAVSHFKKRRVRAKQLFKHVRVTHDGPLRVLFASQQTHELPVQVSQGCHVKHGFEVPVIHEHGIQGPAV